MALITCPECGNQVSTEARACPSCGYPVAERVRAATEDRRLAEPAHDHPVLLEARPSWWNFTWHLIFCWLVIPLLVAIYRRHSFAMRIYPDRVSVEEGVFAKEYSEFFIKDIRSIDVRQGVWGRLFDIGDVIISTAATVDAAEEAVGVPNPNRIRDLLIAQRQRLSEK